MFQVFRQIALPLVFKELVEQSARRRTYVIRIVYVSLFFLACMSVILPEYYVASRTAPTSILGIGRNVFLYIVVWQFIGIYLFLPALACGALTVEKERNTLGLLFLTRLGPWTIVLEKLFSRLVPMFYLMLCSLPLLAFSISLGGVNTRDLFIAVWYLSLTAFQVCSISIACSAFFRTTTAALMTCYFCLFMVTFGVPISDWLLFDNHFQDRINEYLQYWYGPQVAGGPFMPMPMLGEVVMFSFFGLAQFIMRMEGRISLPSDSLMLILTNGPLILSGLVPIPIARLFVVRRAFIAPRNLVLLVLRWIDRVFRMLNNNPVTKGVIVLDESREEPYFSPIAWRETHKRSLGQTVYLIRVFLALEIPVLCVIMSLIFRSSDRGLTMDYVLNFTTIIVWLLVALLVTVTSAGLISGERGRQTLDILLTMPVSGRKIIIDKVAGVRRLMWVCGIPLVTCIIFEAWWRDVVGSYSYSPTQRNYLWWNYLLTSLSMVFIYLPLLSWLALLIGLKTKSPTRATLTALFVVAGWCVLPLVIVLTYWSIAYGRPLENDFSLILQVSPVGLLYQSEFSSLHPVPLLPMFFNVMFYGSCFLIIRSYVLTNADRLLGRSRPVGQALTRPMLLTATEPLPQAASLVD